MPLITMQFAIFQYIAISICGIFIAAIGLYVLYANARRAINRWFCVLSLGIAAWNIGLSLLFFFHDTFFITVILDGAILIAVGLFYFGKVFPTGAVKKREWWYLIPAVATAIMVPFGLVISSVAITATGYLAPHNEFLFPVYGLSQMVYALGGVHFLIRKYMYAEGQARQKLRYFFFGIIVLVCVGLLCDVILPSFSLYQFNLFGPLASLVLVVATAYSILRHNLMDISVVIQRSVIYIVLLSVIVATYAFGLELVGYLLSKITNVAVIVSAGATMVLGIFFMHPIRTYLERVTDPIFFKNKYVYSDAIARLSRMLNTTMSQADLVAASSAALEELFKTSQVAFLLANKGEEALPAWASDIRVSQPIIFEHTVIGKVILGKKRSGDAYTSQDMQLLETFLDQAAVALEKGRLYEKVEEYNTQLERLVDDRTKEIQHIQEEQKRMMIDISHNLQTPLAIINNDLETMADYYPDQDKIFSVKRSFLRVSEFIRQLLHLARLDGVYDITLTTFDLSEFLRQQVEYFEVMGNEQDLEVTADIQDGVVFTGDMRLLGEAFTNIAQNAIKYRRENVKSTLHITLRDDDTTVTVSIKDNGMGIEAKDLSSIFDRFYRTSRSSQISKGSGLGLAIVKKIVDMHHGSIAVHSVLQEGTEFVLTFPKTITG